MAKSAFCTAMGGRGRYTSSLCSLANTTSCKGVLGTPALVAFPSLASPQAVSKPLSILSAGLNSTEKRASSWSLGLRQAWTTPAGTTRTSPSTSPISSPATRPLRTPEIICVRSCCWGWMCAGTDQPGGAMNSNSKDWPLVCAVVLRNVIRSPVRGFSIVSPRCAITCLLALFPCSLRHNPYSTGRPTPLAAPNSSYPTLVNKSLSQPARRHRAESPLGAPVGDDHRLDVGGILSTRLKCLFGFGEAVMAGHHGVKVDLARRGEVYRRRVGVRVTERARQCDLAGLDERERHARLFVRLHPYHHGGARRPDAANPVAQGPLVARAFDQDVRLQPGLFEGLLGHVQGAGRAELA